MVNDNVLRMQPTDVADASARLDALATRVEQMMQTEDPHLTVSAGARDEVSQRVATTLNSVHEVYGTALDKGVTEMRETAATLRAQADDVANLDEGFAL